MKRKLLLGNMGSIPVFLITNAWRHETQMELIDLIINGILPIAMPPVMLAYLTVDSWWNAKETQDET